jgi:hypothetical protein
MLRLLTIAAVALATMSSAAEAKKGLRFSSPGSKASVQAPAPKPPPAAPAAASAARRSTTVVIIPGSGGLIGSAAASEAPAPADPAQRSFSASAPRPIAVSRPAPDPDARRLPVLGGDPGDLRPARSFQSLN